MEEVINELKIKIDDKNSEIENITKDKLEQEKVITELQQSISLNSINIDDTSHQKRIDKALKTVLPHLLFTKQSIKQIVNDAPLSDMVTLETVSQLLVALNSNHSMDDLHNQYSCEHMGNNVYRLKKPPCRVYFYFVPKEIKAQNSYKNIYAEVIYVLYKKKQQSVPDYILNSKPSWRN